MDTASGDLSLLEARADIHKSERLGMTPTSADKDKAVDRMTPMHHVAQDGQVVCCLLKARSDMSKANNTLKTPILAAKSGHRKVVRKLLKAGAVKDRTDINGMTAMHLAAQDGHRKVVHTLLRARADMDMADNQARTHAMKGDHELLRHLLEAGADKDKTDIDRMTPIDAQTHVGVWRYSARWK